MTFDEARALFPVLERKAYLNAGTFGPLARPTLDAMESEQRSELEHGRFGKTYFERMLALRLEVRAALARLVGVEVEQVALTGSTTDGCNVVLAGLELSPEDEIVTTDSEHFGLLGPLHASGARVVVVRPDADAILAAVTPRTRLLALSHVLWTTGAVLPVHELHERTGIPILVDGAQSVGAIPVDARGLDFYTISGQKWLCGPDSTGALVVADPERLRVARPSYFSQASYEPSGRFEPQEGAARFDPNWLAPSALAGLAAALERDTRLAVRARRRAGAALPEAARSARRARSGRRDPRLVPGRRSAGARRPPRRAGRRRPRPARHRPRSRLLRLVDERRRPRAPRCGGRRLDRGRGAQTELLGDRLERGDDVDDVLVERELEQLGARVDLVAVDARRERGLLQLLLDRLRLEPLEPERAHEPARVDEARRSRRRRRASS